MLSSRSRLQSHLHCEQLEDRTVPAFLPPVLSPGEFSGVGDLNGDGRSDLVVSDYDADTVSVRLGNGDGTFQLLGAGQSVPNLQSGEAVADFDGDGKLDVLTRDFGALKLLRGNGDGTLQTPIKSNAVGIITSFQVADLNNDDRPDAIASSFQMFPAGGPWFWYLSIMLAQPNGTFTTTDSMLVGYSVTDHGGTDSQAPPKSVRAGDFNGDGRQDVMTIASSTANNAYPSRLLLGNGDGTVQIGPDVSQFVAVEVTVADLNRDRKADVIRKDTNGLTSTVFLGQGNGQFTKTKRVPIAETPVIADINRDRKPDFVVLNATNDTVSVLLGNGDGKFKAPQDFSTGLMPTAIAVGDFDGDGWLDVVAAGGGTLSALLNDRTW